MTIYEKLAEVQQKIKAPKGQFNSFGKYNYRSCEDICEAVKPLLGEVGVALRLTDSIEVVADRIYVKATACLFDTSDGSSIESNGWAREPLDKKGMDASQVTGASSSYARKYALAGLLLLDDNKDADATNDHGKKPTKTIVQNGKERIYKCAECGEPLAGCTDAMYATAVASSPDGKVRCRKCREEMKNA